MEAPYFGLVDEKVANLQPIPNLGHIAKRAYMTGILAAVTDNLLLPRSEQTQREIRALAGMHTIIDEGIPEPFSGIRQSLSQHHISNQNIASTASAIAQLVAETERPVISNHLKTVMQRDRTIASKSLQVLRLEEFVADSILERDGSSKRSVEPLPQFVPKLINSREWRRQLYIQYTAQELGMSLESANDLLVEEGYHPSIARVIVEKRAKKASENTKARDH